MAHHAVPEATPASESTDDAAIEGAHKFALLHLNEYIKTPEPEIIEKAIRMAHVSAQLILPLKSHPLRSEVLRTYHNLLLDRSKVADTPWQIIDPVLTLNQTLDSIPEDNSYAAEAVNFMIKISRIPFQKELQPDDLDGRSLIRSLILYHVGRLCLQIFEGRHIHDDLARGITALRAFVKHAPGDMEERLLGFGKLAFYLQRSYDLDHNLDNLEESIGLCQQALDMVATGNAEDRSMILDTYANGLQSRAKRNASVEDITRAIDLALAAVAEETRPTTKVQYLNNLSTKFDDRFDLICRAEDMHEAIRVNRSALEYDPDGFLLRLTKHSLGTHLLKLPGRQNAQVEEALKLLIEATDTPDQVSATWLTSLSYAYYSRFLQQAGNQSCENADENLDDLITAIRYQTEAVQNLPRSHGDWPSYAVTMASLLRERAERTGDPADVHTALAFVEAAAESLPKNHIHHAGIKYELAQIYTLANRVSNFSGRFEIIVDDVRHSPPWEEKAVEIYSESLDDTLGNPLNRMRAAKQLMMIHSKRGKSDQGAEIGVRVLDILQKTNLRLLSRHDQQRIAAQFSDIAVEVCAFSIQAGHEAARALERLERGRGIILSLLIEDRSDISALAESHPEQAARFERLRDEISQPAGIGLDVVARQELVSRRDRQVRELDEALEEIRRLPGQERFFRGPSAEELQSRTAEGPIVVVNVAGLRSDGIIVSTSGIRVLHLPGLKQWEVQEWMEREPARWRRHREKGDKNNLCREFLSWLWKACVEPILTTLGFLETLPAIHLPRVWWIGTGMAASLPFHAAGNHLNGSKANAFSYIISSYTPTIRALEHSWDRATALREMAVGEPRLFVALMPTTPDVDSKPVPDLESVRGELSAIAAAVATTHSVISVDHPSRKEVLENLESCDMAHFSCHGFSDATDPSSSFLVLQGRGDEPSSPPVAEKLTVQDVFESRLGRSRIAYLSACSTAENRAEQLADEVIHLASGFQVAGFPHVIGALWPTDDRVSVEVARMFYEKMSAAHPADDRTVALALREAAMSMRDRHPRQPLLWAGYIHIGV